MNISTVRIEFAQSVCLFCLVALCGGCGNSADGGFVSGGDTFTVPANLAGTWSFSASESQPPSVLGCTGDLALSGSELRSSFTLPVTQVGVTLTGASVIPCTDSDLTAPSTPAQGIVGLGSTTGPMSHCTPANVALYGTVTGTTLAGTIADSVGSSTLRTAFVAEFDGESLTVTPLTITADGRTGSCGASGTYVATR